MPCDRAVSAKPGYRISIEVTWEGKGYYSPGVKCAHPKEMLDQGLSNMNNNALNIGVIGTGGMGGRHARNLALHTANANVVAVMDQDAGRADAVAEECGGASVYTDAVAMISDANVDAVVTLFLLRPVPNQALVAVGRLVVHPR